MKLNGKKITDNPLLVIVEKDKNLISDLAGVICDGAKDSCSLKLSTAAGTAIQSALFSLHRINVKATDGIVALSSEQTMQNIGRLSTQGMMETDRTILQIVVNKLTQFKVLNKRTVAVPV